MQTSIKSSLKNIFNNEYINIFIFFFCLLALTNSGYDTSEGVAHYNLAEHLIKTGQLGYDTPPSLISPDGKTYVPHEFGNTLFMLPTALLNILLEQVLSLRLSENFILRIKQFITSFNAVLYATVTATAFFGILRKGFSLSIISGFFATLSLVLTTYFWDYSRNLFDGVLCMMFLTLSFFFLINYKKDHRLNNLVICFICLGFGLITRITMILPIITSIFYLFILPKTSWKLKMKSVGIALLTLIPFVVWQSWYNNLRTGVFYLSPVQLPVYADNNALDNNIVLGLVGLLFSPGKSIFVYAPLLILSVVLFKKFYREYRKEALYVLILSILWFLLHARLRNWSGAWGWGPRFLITILPILFLPVAVNIEYIWAKRSLKIPGIILASFGFILSLSSIICNWHYRMAYANQRGMLDNSIFVWGFWNSQPVDMLKGAVGNIVRLITRSPLIKVEGASQINQYISSTINIWPNSFLAVDIPWYIVAVLVMPLLILMYLSWRNIWNLQVEN